MSSGVRNSAMHFMRLQRGQAVTEYTVVVFFAVMVLLVPDENGDVAIIKLANAFKTFYNAFAYAISFSTPITPF